MKPFVAFINEVNDGQIHEKLTSALADVLRSVRDTGKKGSLTLKIDVKPGGKHAIDKVTIDHLVKVSLPEMETASDMFYLTEDADWSRQHPKQQALNLRPAEESGPLTIRKV